MGLRRDDEKCPARPWPVEQRECSTEPFIYLLKPPPYLTFARGTEMQVVVDGEAVAPLNVRDQLVEEFGAL